MVNLTPGSMGQPDISASWCKAMWLFLQVSRSSACDLLGDEEGSREPGSEGSRRGQRKAMWGWVPAAEEQHRNPMGSSGAWPAPQSLPPSRSMLLPAGFPLGAPFPPFLFCFSHMMLVKGCPVRCWNITSMEAGEGGWVVAPKIHMLKP